MTPLRQAWSGPVANSPQCPRLWCVYAKARRRQLLTQTPTHKKSALSETAGWHHNRRILTCARVQLRALIITKTLQTP